jgi:5-methylcytosine-specific restriction endonuclease McrA
MARRYRKWQLANHRTGLSTRDPAAYRRHYRAMTRKAQQELKLSLGCAACGVRDLPAYCYQFDHIDPTTKSGGISKQKNGGAWQIEAAKCQVLCANCHAKRTGELEHWGKRGAAEPIRDNQGRLF